MATPIEILHCVVYLSTAREPFSGPQLDALLHQARDANQRAGLTGALFYQDGQFIQAIEGPRHAVEQLMTRIRTDQRHHAITVLFEEEATTRRFSGWAMGLVRPESLPNAEIAKFDPLANAIANPTRDVVLMLLNIFRRRMG